MPDELEFVSLLPWALRRDTERYLSAVRENAPELFHSARVRFSSDILQQVLLLAAIQKIWAMVNSQAWIVDSSLTLIGRATASGADVSTVGGLRLGRSTYTRDSADFRDLIALRTELDGLLRRLELRNVIRRASVVDLIRHVSGSSARGR